MTFSKENIHYLNFVIFTISNKNLRMIFCKRKYQIILIDKKIFKILSIQTTTMTFSTENVELHKMIKNTVKNITHQK